MTHPRDLPEDIRSQISFRLDTATIATLVATAAAQITDGTDPVEVDLTDDIIEILDDIEMDDVARGILVRDVQRMVVATAVQFVQKRRRNGERRGSEAS